MHHFIICVTFLLSCASAQTVENHPFECNGRDPECSFSNERNNWVCEYNFDVHQAMTMRQEAGPDGNGDHTYPVSFPVKLREREDSDFAEPYYMDCSVSQYNLPAGVGNDCVNVSLIDLESYTGSEETPIILDGFPRKVSTINKEVPSATLCVGHGDIVRVLVTNDFEGGYEATTLHWHGMFQRDSFWDDGPAFIAQCPINPHSQYQYDFVADPPGTFWYHAHAGVQIADGMFGALIVLPEDDIEESVYGDTYDVEQPDEIVVLADWNHENYQETMAKHPGHWVMQDTGIPITNPISPEDGSFTSGHPYVSGHINGHGEFEGNNLKPYVFNVLQDSRIRFRLMNVAATFPYRVSIDDHMVTIIAVDGLDVEHITVDGFIVYPAERVDFVLNTTLDAATNITDFWLRAESLSEDGEVKAIVHFDTDPENPTEVLYRPQTNSTFETKCLTQECVVAFCPWPENYRLNTNILCTQHADLRRNRDQDEIRNHDAQLPDVEDAIAKGNIINLNFNILGSPTIQVPNVEGIFGTLPATPPFLNDGVAPDRCNLTEKSGSFETCNHIRELQYNETYIIVLVNRWPAVTNLQSGANFPGIQTHPVHMHGHSFYVLAQSQGTIREEGTADRALGCQNGVGHTDGFEYYCWDEETIDENLVCEEYWGDCSFQELPELTPIEKAPQKDTIPVPVHGYVVVAIRADNPGWWYFHCHIDAHVAQGMNIILSEAPDMTKNLVKNELLQEGSAPYPGCGSYLY